MKRTKGGAKGTNQYIHVIIFFFLVHFAFCSYNPIFFFFFDVCEICSIVIKTIRHHSMQSTRDIRYFVCFFRCCSFSFGSDSSAMSIPCKNHPLRQIESLSVFIPVISC